MTLKDFQKFNKVLGNWSMADGPFEAVGFDKQGRLCHLTNDGIRPISIAESAKIISKIEDDFAENSHRYDCEQDADARERWFRLIGDTTVKLPHPAPVSSKPEPAPVVIKIRVPRLRWKMRGMLN